MPRLLTAPAAGQRVAGIRSAVSRQWTDPLSRGGLALLVNTGLTGILGFGYWIIAARLFSTYAVGVAGALVAATTLFSGLGQLNLSGMLMRFLPKAHEKSRRLVLLTYAFAAGVSFLLASVSLICIRYFASPASPLRLDTVQSITFVLAAAATAIFTIQDSVLIAVRRAVWIPAENGSFGVAKIGMLFVLAPLGSAFAIFGAWMIPLTLTIPIISLVLLNRYLPRASQSKRSPLLGKRVRSKMIRFAVGDATGGLFTQAWTYLPPVIITASLGPSVNALYFISFLFSSTIDQVAANYASPLTVEGVHSPDQMATLIRSALRHIYMIIFPVVIALLIICPWLVRAFGEKYADAVPFMRLLLIACLPKAITTVYYAYCRVQRSTHKSAMMQAYICTTTLTAVVVLAHPFKLFGICLAILAVQTSTGTASWWILRREFRIKYQGSRHGRHRQRPQPTGIATKLATKLPGNGHMHVMHVIDSLHGGGAETSLLEVVPGLANRGIKTSIVTVLPDDKALESRLDALGVTPIRLRRCNPLGMMLELRNVIQSQRPDLVHTTLLFSNLIGRIAARTIPRPVVTTLANQDYGPEHRANSRYGAWSVRSVHAADVVTAPLTTRFHAISKDVAKVMSRRLRIRQDRIRVVYRGRDPARLGVPSLERRLRTRAALSIDPEALLVLSAGRLDRQKGVETTIDAFRRLVTRIPDAVLLIAGRPGNADAAVRAEAERTPGVRLLGHRADMPDLMCAADVLSFPSRWEGLGGTLIEAMALRLGIVASDIPPVAETIGDVGWPLVPPDNGQALAEGLISVLEGGARNEAKKDAGVRRFLGLFTADAASDGMADLYRDVLLGSGRRP